MDAAHTLLKKSVLLLPLALFAIAPVIQAQPSFNAIGAVTLSGTGGTNVAVSGTSDGSAPITFTTSIDSTTVPTGDPSNWLTVTAGGTTPGNINLTPSQLGFTQGTYTAVVHLHATAPAGVPDITFTASYSSGSTGGGGGQNGTITATPSSVTVSTTSGNAVTTTVTLSTSSPTAITFSLGFDQTWLSAGGVTAGTVSSAGTATLSITANAFGLANNTYTGHITVTPSAGTATTVPVTFTVGGAGGTGTITATPNPINWTYTSNSGVFPSQSVTLVSSSAAATYTATATSNPGWLLVNGVTAANGTIVGGLTASVNGTVAALPSGLNQGSIQVTDSNGGSVTIQVNLTVNGGTATDLTFNPSTGLTFTSAVGGGTTAGQTVSITSQASGTLTVSCTSAPQTWLQCSTSPTSITLNSPQTITLTANPGSLSAGTYNGQLSATVNGTSTGSVPITLVVGGGSGGSSGQSVAPTSLVFSYQTGTNNNFVSRQAVAFTGPAGTGWSTAITTTDNGAWLQVSTILGVLQPDGTGTTTVIINPNGLAVGTYNGNLSIIFTGTGTSQNVAVTLSVVNGPVLLPTPGSVIFNFHTGGAALQPQSIFLAASDGSAVTGTAATATPWLTVTQQANSSSFAVSANPAGMAAGLYSGAVTVTQSGAGNSPLAIPVVLIVNGGSGSGGGSGTLTLPASLTFNAAVGVSPAAQSLSATASTATNFTVGATTTNGGNWLSLSQSSGVTPANISVFVNSAILAIGTYNGTITFTANGISQTVPVTLNVSTTGVGSGSITATPASLSFTGQAGAGSLAGQTLTISSTQGTSPVSFTLSTSGGTWLTTSAQSGATLSTPLQLTVNANVAGLTAGPYTGSIIITPAGGTAVTVPVNLTVTAATTVSATPTSLTFAYRAGDAVPATQSVSVTGGGGSLPFAATASSNGNWLVVSPATGTTPGTLTVSVAPTALNASTTPYTGTITVTGTGTATGTTTIQVSLTVTAPLPTVAKLTNAGSFVSASISPGEIITLFGTNIGPTTAAGLARDATGKVSTTIGGVQVLVNGFACPMIFASGTQVSAVVPYEIAGFVSADVLVKFAGLTSNAIHVNVATTAPGLFTANSSGTGPGAILNSNNSVNSPNNPATKGDIVVVYLTGEGQTSPAGVTGKVTTVSTTPPLTPGPLLGVSVLIGPAGAQQPANFTFAGEAPGFVSGAMQLNVQIPTNAASGDQPIVVSIGGNQSQSGVTVSVK